MSLENPLRVLFVCTANICRSAMAEYLLQDKVDREAPGLIEVASAGTSTMGGDGALSVTVTIMNELGIDITPHRSQPVTRRLLKNYDIALGMTREHFDDIQDLAPDELNLSILGSWPELPSIREHDIEDPYGQSINSYRIFRDRISKEIDRIFPTLVERAQQKV